MKILFACGGTAGHINPAIAMANMIRRRHPDAQILFVGNPNGMEARLVPSAGYHFAPIEIMGFQRKINLRNIKNNCRSVVCLLRSWERAKKLIEAFHPDVLVGTGGYVSGPVLREGSKLGYKTLTHESNAYPGVTTRLLARTADKVLLAVEESRKHLPERDYIVTGNPVREEIITADRAQVREKMNIGQRICILSFGGSLGARCINQAVAELMKWEQEKGGFYHIHATGSYERDRFAQLLKEQAVQDNDGINVREYIDDMANCLAAADLVISRSGAMTLTELEDSGTASILIPSPNVAENHQYHNAMVLQNHDAAVVIEEKDLTPELLRDTVARLCNDRKILQSLGENARRNARFSANEDIYKEIMQLIAAECQ